jgi:hypothetical protein
MNDDDADDNGDSNDNADDSGFIQTEGSFAHLFLRMRIQRSLFHFPLSPPSAFVVRTRDIGSSTSDALSWGHTLWSKVFDVAMAWVNMSNEGIKSSSSNSVNNKVAAKGNNAVLNKYTVHALQVDADPIEGSTSDAFAFMQALMTGNTTNMHPEHVNLLSKLVLHLETEYSKKATIPSSSAETRPALSSSLLVQLQGGEIPHPTTLISRTHELAHEVLNLQVGAKLSSGIGIGASPVWDCVVHTYWSFLYTVWIKSKIAGTSSSN